MCYVSSCSLGLRLHLRVSSREASTHWRLNLCSLNCNLYTLSRTLLLSLLLFFLFLYPLSSIVYRLSPLVKLLLSILGSLFNLYPLFTYYVHVRVLARGFFWPFDPFCVIFGIVFAGKFPSIPPLLSVMDKAIWLGRVLLACLSAFFFEWEIWSQLSLLCINHHAKGARPSQTALSPTEKRRYTWEFYD